MEWCTTVIRIVILMQTFGANADRFGLTQEDRLVRNTNLETVVHSCGEQKRVMGLENSDQYIIVEAMLGQKVILDCYGCKISKNFTERKAQWFHRSRFFTHDVEEIIPDFNLEENEKKITIDVMHSLEINNFLDEDAGIYFCSIDEFTGYKFNYVVDVVPKNTPNVEIIDYNKAKEFSKHFSGINEALMNFEVPTDMWSEIDSPYKLVFQVSYQWTSWGNCNACGRASTQGIQRRFGKCKISVPAANPMNKVRGKEFEKYNFGIQFSCHSLVLHKILDAKLAEKVSSLPNFVETKECQGMCYWNERRKKLDVHDKVDEENMEFDITITPVKVRTGEVVTFQCESLLENEVAVWTLDDQLLEEALLKEFSMELTVTDFLKVTGSKKLDSKEIKCYVENNLKQWIRVVIKEEPLSMFPPMMVLVALYVVFLLFRHCRLYLTNQRRIFPVVGTEEDTA